MDIPIKNLIKVNSTDEVLSNTASFSNLRHCALTALFRYAPNQTYPAYASRNFRLIAHYDDSKNSKKPIRTDEDLTKALDMASSEHLMDDNDGVIFHVYCKFVNDHPSSYDPEDVKKFRASATAAADRAVKKMKRWVSSAQRFIHKKARIGKGSDDFVVVNDQKNDDQKDDSPVEWASRFVEYLFAPDLFEKDSVDRTREVIIRSFQTASGFAMESAERINIMMADFDKSVYNRKPAMSKESFPIPSPTPSLDGCSIGSCASSVTVASKEEDKEEGVEIIFDPESNSPPEEWKIFFGDNVQDKSPTTDIVSETGSFCSADDGMMVDSPSGDVLSLPSSEAEESKVSSTSSFSKINAPVGDNDDDSWALCDDM